MAPKKNIKRTAQETKAAPPAAKKPKTDSATTEPKTDPTMTGVIEGIQQASDLSDDCRQMLLSLLPGSLAIPSDQRHEVQHTAVDMIAEALAGVEASLQASIDNQKASLTDVEGTKSELDSKVAAVEVQLSSATQFQESKKAALAEAQRGKNSAAEKLTAAQEAQRLGDAEVVVAKEQKHALDNGMDVHMKAILSEGLDEAQGEAHYKALLPVVKSLCLDDSLMTALPAACARQIAERGAFDKMVLDQLEKSLVDKAGELQKTLDESAPAAAERAAAVEAAEAELETAKAKQKEAADELVNAQKSSAEASKAVDAAKAAVKTFVPDYQKATAALDACVESLNKFKEHNMVCFETLKVKVAKQTVPAVSSPAKPTIEVAASPMKKVMEVEASPAKPVEVGGA